MATTRRRRRKYFSPLRERQSRETRAAVLEALVRLFAERGVQGFTVDELAERAGVSSASVYRHFPTRVSLLDGLYEHAEDVLPSTPDGPATLKETRRFASELFSSFGASPALVRGVAVLSLSAGTRSAIARRRDPKIDALIRKELSGLPERDRRLLSVLMRYLIGSIGYTCLTELYGLTSAEAEDAAGWAVEALLESAKEKRKQKPVRG